MKSTLVVLCGWIGIVCCIFLIGCSAKAPLPKGANGKSDSRATTPQQSEAAATAIQNLGELVVYKTNGEESKLSEYMGKHYLVLVFSRGYFGSICPYCSTQMHALAEAYSQFEERDARVLVVFPVSDSSDRDRWKELESSILDRMPQGSQLPFPILVDNQLAAVDKLGIRAQLSKPSTFIIDKTGKERYRYIGSNPADRPDVPTLLNKLDSVSHP